MIAATRRLCSMRSWQCESFGAESLLKTRPTPEISTPNDVLLKVKASSVNNIDVMMRRGYGNEMFTRWRQLQYCQWEPPSRLPITVGRDCSAVVEAVGGNVTRFKPGDEVIAVVEPIYQGTHAEYTIANEAYCAPKPTNLSHVECAALPYVACTNWAALVSIAQIKPFQAHSQRVLIHGGAGGMGTTAIQLLRAWGCEHIVATCSADSFKTVKELGAIPLDYSDAKIRDQIIAQGPFDVILDCVDTELARWSDTIMGIWRNSVHVSVVAPLLQDTDRYGVNVGLLSTAIKHFTRSVESAVRGRWYSYAFFMPNSDCMSQLSTFLQEGQVKPIIDEVFSFEEVPKAYEKVGQLKGRGKTVIDFEKSSN